MKTVLITGAGGFIARMIARRCRQEGWHVVGTSRTARPLPDYDQIAVCTLGQSLANGFDTPPDAVIHAAHQDGPDLYAVNVSGTERWLDEAAARWSPFQVFLSTLSAASPRPTDYGRAKRDLETRFLNDHGAVIRLGLVAGNGGVFGRMVTTIRRSQVVPLLDGGRTPVYVVNPDFLVDIVARLLEAPGEFSGRTWTIHQPAAHSLSELMHAIRNHCGARCHFISVPSALVLWPTVALEKLTPLRLPVTSTNIRGLRVSPHDVPSDFVRLGGVEIPLDALVHRAIFPVGADE